MYYLTLEKFLNQPDADLKNMLAEASHLAKTLELLGAGYNRENRSDVLSDSRKVPQSARC